MKIRAVLGAVALVLIATAARGDEKVLRLKNGRKIQGEVLDETPTGYVVKTPGGGKTTIAKDQVASIEDAPPPEKRPDAPGVESPGAPVSSPSETKPSPPLVPEGDLAAAKKVLLAVPPDDGTPRGKEARAQALEDVKERVSLATLVALVAEPAPDGPAPERLLARQLVCGAPAEKVRPLLLKAVSVCDFKRPRQDLMIALAAFPADKEGKQTETLFAKVDELRVQGIALDDFSGAMAETKAHDKLETLYMWLLDPKTKPGSVPGVAKLCQAVQSTLEEPDTPLLKLATMLQDEKDLFRLQHAFVCLRDSDGRIAGPLSRLIRPIEREADRQEKVPAEVVACLSEAYQTLARLPSPNVPPAAAPAAEGYGYLVTTLQLLRHHELRGVVINAIKQIRPTNEFPTRGYLDRLLGVMTDGGLDDSEQNGVAEALRHLTGQKLGRDVAAWREYVDKLQR